jgi:hypothetical protein
MIYSTVYQIDGDGVATVVWRAETTGTVVAEYVQVLFGPDSDPHATHVTVETAIPPQRPGRWDGPARVRCWARPCGADTHSRTRPRRWVFMWTWDHVGFPTRGWRMPPVALRLGGRLTRMVLVACDGPWRDDDPVLGSWDLSALSADEALLARDRIITVFGGRAGRRLRETWSRP